MSQDTGFRRELRNYVIGLVLALGLSGAAFGLVAWSGWSARATLIAIAVLAGVQLVAHFRFFLHVDLRKSHRDDLQLILFTAVIIGLMVGGSLWIIFNQNLRMM